jgi:hypothetical protein
MSVTVQIPGGTAELFEPKELTPRRQIPSKALLYRSDKLLGKLATARRVTSPDGETDERPELDGEDVRLTEHEAITLEEIQYATTWGFLKAWTLNIPLPATWDALLDVPLEVTTALNEAVSKLGNPDVVADFEMTPETLRDTSSFTGASEERKTQSEANAKRRTSTRKPSTR